MRSGGVDGDPVILPIPRGLRGRSHDGMDMMMRSSAIRSVHGFFLPPSTMLTRLSGISSGGVEVDPVIVPITPGSGQKYHLTV